jgi:Tol biopolymer transport system component
MLQLAQRRRFTMKRSHLLTIPLLVVFHACSPHDSTGVDDGFGAPALALQLTDQWGPAVPVNGGALLNTSALEGCPSESPDGRSLYFASNRGGDIDIYVSHRQATGEWSDPELLPKGTNSVNSGANDYCPTSLPGGRLMFVSERNDGLNCGTGTADIYETHYQPAEGWAAPEHLGCVVNSAGHEFAPSLVAAGGGMLFFSSNRGSDSKHAIYVSVRGSDGEWQVPVPVAELNAPGYNTFRPNVSVDGREVVFDSDRPTSTGPDIWYAYRANVNAAWSSPVRLVGGGGTAVNSAAGETRASLSRDGQRLYFGSNRDGVSFNLFVAERR